MFIFYCKGLIYVLQARLAPTQHFNTCISTLIASRQKLITLPCSLQQLQSQNLTWKLVPDSCRAASIRSCGALLVMASMTPLPALGAVESQTGSLQQALAC